MRLAMVVHRFGLEIRGGAELHCRLIAELLSRNHDVEIVTTCAKDYLTWANAYPAGLDNVNGLPVWRFPVRRPRDLDRFARLQQRVFYRDHSDAEAHAWLNAQGPLSPAMRDWIGRYKDNFDYWICYSYRYWTTYHAMQVATGKGILVPTAEADPAIDVPMFRSLFQDSRAIVFNTAEERDMILDRSDSHDVPSDIIGVGIQEPSRTQEFSHSSDPARFRREFEIEEPFFLYIGRIDSNKGCNQLFNYHLRAVERAEKNGQQPRLLVLIGHPVIPIPDHPSVRHIGAVDEQQKFDALAAASFLVMPSFYESLSMVLLEAWALSKPVLVNAHCEVLRGQVERSNGGLYYANNNMFMESLNLLMNDRRLREACGKSGRKYFEGNYQWPIIEQQWERLLGMLETKGQLRSREL